MTPALSLYVLAAGRAEALMAHRRRQNMVGGERQRPRGELVWLHIGEGEDPCSATALAQRISEERPEATFLMSADDAPARGDAWTPRPPDFPRAVEAFLTAWSPDVAVWFGGPIWPVLASKTRQAGVEMLLVNGTSRLAAAHRGVPARELLALFGEIRAMSRADARALARVLRREVAAGRLQRSSRPPDHDELEHQHLRAALQSRPIWYAAHVTRAEVEAVGAAHALGQSASHKLLLIAQPADEAAAQALGGLSGARRSEGGNPATGAAVLVADLPGEEGLWYRMASVSFVGGSLAGPQARLDPFEPAALGSAIIHGPHLAPHEMHFQALEAARATRRVSDARGLGQAIAELLAPDRAAALAQSAWGVVSEGAEATDEIADSVCRILDGRT